MSLVLNANKDWENISEEAQTRNDLVFLGRGLSSNTLWFSKRGHTRIL